MPESDIRSLIVVRYALFSVCPRKGEWLGYLMGKMSFFQSGWWPNGECVWITENWMHGLRRTIFICPSCIKCWTGLQERGDVFLMVIWVTTKSLLHRKIKGKPLLLIYYGSFAFKRITLGCCNALATFQISMMPIFSDMVEDTIEAFMDDFSVVGDSFDHCLNHLFEVLERCEDCNLVLN